MFEDKDVDTDFSHDEDDIKTDDKENSSMRNSNELDDEDDDASENDQSKENDALNQTEFKQIDVPNIESSDKSVKVKLLHLTGSRKGRIDIIDLTSLPDMICTIGRDPECVLAFDPYEDQRVSSVHARILYLSRDDEICLEDLNSTNGTRINGIKVYEMTRLRDGDEIELGRKGVSFEFSRIMLESEEAEIKKFQRIAKLKNKEIQANDVSQANGIDDGGNVKIIKEMVKQVSSESSSNLKTLIAAMSVVILILLVGLIVVITLLIQEINNDESERIARDKSIIDKIDETNNTSSSDLDNGNGNNKKVEIVDPIKKNMNNDSELVKKENHIRNNPGMARFKEVNRDSRDAVYLIVSSIELVDDKGGKHIATSSGTGFVVTKDGHLITNKHVVKPWLFEDLALKIRKNSMKILPETHNILAWKTGSEALTESGEWKESTAYSLLKDQIKIENEGFDSFKTIEDTEIGEIRVHDNDSHDIILLKLIGSDFKYLDIYDASNSTDWEPEQLDSCLVIGFPEGKKTLEGTIAETAPTTGEIRKIEGTIAISAPVLKGNSGGPVIVIDTTRDKPLVIGVASKVAKNTETYGICIKSKYILDLLPPEYR